MVNQSMLNMVNIVAGKMHFSFIIVFLCAQGGSEIWMAESQTVIASLAFHPVDRMLVIGTYNELHFWDWSRPEPFAKCFTLNEREKIRSVSTEMDNTPHYLIPDQGTFRSPAKLV